MFPTVFVISLDILALVCSMPLCPAYALWAYGIRTYGHLWQRIPYHTYMAMYVNTYMAICRFPQTFPYAPMPLFPYALWCL